MSLFVVFRTPPNRPLEPTASYRGASAFAGVLWTSGFAPPGAAVQLSTVRGQKVDTSSDAPDLQTAGETSQASSEPGG